MSAGSNATPIQKHRSQQRRRQHIVSIAAFLILLTAWLVGRAAPGPDLEAYIGEVLPDAARIERRGDLFIAYAADAGGAEQVSGYAMAGSAIGYGGPVLLLVGTDPAGVVTGVRVVAHQETPNFFRQLETRGFYAQFDGLDYTSPLRIGSDLDGVSGATLSAEAVAQSIRSAVRSIATSAVDGAQIAPEQTTVKFGAPEATLLALFGVSFVLHRLKRRPTLKRYGRWAVLIAGLIFLGFVFNKPLTLANIITLLSGVWPDWQNNLYWFLLLGGVITVTLIQGKNPYCSWFCPFGAAQEILGTLSGVKAYQPRQLYARLQWVQRGLSFTAITLGLALRQPGAASYEPFGTLFALEGSWPQWVLLIMVLFGSLVIYRPFCNYLCPLDPVVDYIGEIRHGMRNLWQQRSRLNAGTSGRSS